MFLLDETKTERQIAGIDKFVGANGRGIFHYPPGFGKTYCGILAAVRLLKGKENEKEKVLILVPSLGVQDVWKKIVKEFDWQSEDCYFNIDVKSVGSVDSLEKLKEYKLCIIDEYHKFTSDNRMYIVNKIIDVIPYILGLTATPAFGSKLHSTVPLVIIDSISEQYAIVKGWISNFIEYNIKVEFSEDDKVRYTKFSVPIFELQELFRDSLRLMNDGRKIYDSAADLLFSCFYGKTVYIEGEAIYIGADRVRSSLSNRRGWNVNLDLTNDYNKELNANWSPQAIEFNAKQFVNLIRNRNTLLICNKVKLVEIIKLYNFTKVSTIIFNESTDFADMIAEALGHEAIVYHTNIKSRAMWDPHLGDFIRYKSGARKGEPKVFGKTTLRNIAINGMLSGQYKVLISARALDEGVNIPNLEQVITSAGTTNPLTYSQRAGRGKRVDIYKKDKVTKIYNFYFDDFTLDDGRVIYSRDRQKLVKRQEGSTNVIWVNDLSEIV